jgi:hypothetical protein
MLRHLRTVLVLSLVAAAIAPSPPAAAQPQSTCRLGSPAGTIQHVIYLQFDNVHFSRDNPNVPSDLEQMPHLLNFLTANGTLLTQQHTPLIAHTGGDIVTVETGLYPDRQGLEVSNSYRYFTPSGTSRTGVAFTYWTSPVYDPAAANPSDTSFNMLGPDGSNAPAPWVPYTRAGCNVGMAGVANVVLENTATDVATVFGAGSAQAQEVTISPDQAFADFVGIAVHCAQGSNVCTNGQPDRLPQEAGGYSGYQALFGHKSVAPVISPGEPLDDLNGKPIQDTGGRRGFPGFDGLTPAVTLSYIASMQEHGIPVTFGYLSDAHDPHSAPSGTPTYGPGQAEYEAALKAYDAGFDAFFSRLAKDGIDATNTLLIVTADEGDHFVGGPPSPDGCDGISVPCTYPRIGEISVNLTGLLATQANLTTPFSVHADSAPAIYLDGQPQREDPSVHEFARALASLQVDNPYTSASEPIAASVAGEAEQRVLHMITGDPLRTPTLILFADPNYFGFTGGSDCEKPCVAINPTSAWNHGDLGPDITTTWLGVAGPGVQRGGIDRQTWADHADVRPTMLALTGLRDSYASDGRVLFEVLQDGVLPAAVADQRDVLTGLARDYKRINAPVGELGMWSLAAASASLTGVSDAQLTQTDGALDDLATRRADLASQMRALLEGAAFSGQRIDPAQVTDLEAQAQALIDSARNLAPGYLARLVPRS